MTQTKKNKLRKYLEEYLNRPFYVSETETIVFDGENNVIQRKVTVKKSPIYIAELKQIEEILEHLDEQIKIKLK